MPARIWQSTPALACGPRPCPHLLSGPCSLPPCTGECERNVAFMIGSRGLPGHCIKSCGKCADFYEFKGSQDEL